MAKDKTNDMTVGNPVSLIIRFMIPMCLGNIFQQFYNIADSIVAGQFLGVDALAAIGSTGSLMFFVTGWLNGLSSGFAILVSQWFGAKQYDKMRHYVAMSIYLAAAKRSGERKRPPMKARRSRASRSFPLVITWSMRTMDWAFTGALRRSSRIR